MKQAFRETIEFCFETLLRPKMAPGQVFLASFQSEISRESSLLVLGPYNKIRTCDLTRLRFRLFSLGFEGAAQQATTNSAQVDFIGKDFQFKTFW